MTLASFQLWPEDASQMGHSVDVLFITMLVLTGIIVGGIAAVVLYFVIKYRRRNEDDVGQDIGDHISVEIIWTAVPLAICLVIFVWASWLYLRMSKPPADAMVINVIGKQWMWKIQHPSGRKEINELHVPLGKPIVLQMTSQDVIHSFFIPAFRTKQDVLPGRYSEEWFTATKLGEYHLFCSQYCGTSHALMGGTVVVMEPGAYDSWAAQVAPDTRPEAVGKQLFDQYGCVSCHGQQAPTLAGIYNKPQVMQDGRVVIADNAYLRESILDPRAKIVAGYGPIMPSFQGQLSEEQVFDLLAYIKSLGTAASIPGNTSGSATPAATPPVAAPADGAENGGRP